MSSLSRTMERRILRSRAEKDNAKERAKALKKRGGKNKKPTASLGLERNINVFKRYWFGYHYESYLSDKNKNKNKDKSKDTETRVIKRKGDKGKKNSKARRNTQKITGLLNKIRFMKNKKNNTTKNKPIVHKKES
jgi:hypothetical protein